MSKAIVIPEEYALQLLATLNEFKKLYQEQIVGTPQTKSSDHLSEKQAATYLKCSISKLQALRKNNAIGFWKFGRSIRYNKETLDQFIAANSVPGSPVGGRL